MKSMTGYGEASGQIRGTRVTVQVRSLNHRHLDLQLRVPREYLSFEEEIRKVIRDKIARGRLDIFINRAPTKGQGRRLELDEELLAQYLTSVRQAQKKVSVEWRFQRIIAFQRPGALSPSRSRGGRCRGAPRTFQNAGCCLEEA